jgi:hypothetical protein
MRVRQAGLQARRYRSGDQQKESTSFLKKRSKKLFSI